MRTIRKTVKVLIPQCAIDRAIVQLGSPAELAAVLGVRRQAVEQWMQRGTVPANRVLAVEEATRGKIKRHELRPDIYPPRSARARPQPSSQAVDT